MRILYRAGNVKLTQLLRARVGQRLGLALGRFGERIDKVTVQVMNTPPGRQIAEKRCRIDVGLRPRPISVEDADVDLLVALDRATDRILRSVARALEREQELEQNRGGGLGAAGNGATGRVTTTGTRAPRSSTKVAAKIAAKVAKVGRTTATRTTARR